MKPIGDIEKVYRAAEMITEFCAETSCPVCPMQELCNRIDKINPIGQAIMESIRE